MSSAPGDLILVEPAAQVSASQKSQFSNLRGVQWRIDLGILPSSSSSSTDDLRCTAADSRRKYAGLRRRLLIDPHLSKDEGSRTPNLVMDNPLSQNPDSMWGQFFRSAELEKTLDQDLSRLYPEQGSYFQTPTCQATLRRILLLWCLRHPEYGYRQGMHELLAPLLYVLHLDVHHLSQVREIYEDHFNDKFDSICAQESHLAYSFIKGSSPSSSKWASKNEENSRKEIAATVSSLDELDPDVRRIVLLSDAYGTEGELGVLFSERFIEHDAYCMFDALMSGAGGAVAMADYYSPSPTLGSLSGLPPVIEASSALYHLLSMVDSSLHSHLVELGIEPQYFALRWLRVLFGREYSLEDLLPIWDEIFSSCNTKLPLAPEDDMLLNNFVLLSSPRGAFIAGMAVAMLLHVRSSLLAAENATLCLQRLLNFPENINVEKMIHKAKSLQAFALDANACSSPSPGVFYVCKPASIRSYGLSSASISPKTPLNLVPESYWEEKWRVLHKAEELNAERPSDLLSGGKKLGGREILNLSRTESAPPSVEISAGRSDSQVSVRRRLLEDFSKALGNDADVRKSVNDEITSSGGLISVRGKGFYDHNSDQNGAEKSFACMTGDDCLSESAAAIEENLVLSAATSPCSCVHEHEQDSEKSSITSNSSSSVNDDETSNTEEPSSNDILDDPSPSNSLPSGMSTGGHESETVEKHLKERRPLERKPLSSKFQWFWKFGRSNDSNLEKEGNMESQNPVNTDGQNHSTRCSSFSSGSDFSVGMRSSMETADKNMMGTLRGLGQSMLENIQVIESVFQQDRGQVSSLENLSRNILGGKGPVTAMGALTELRKISNLLSEM